MYTLDEFAKVANRRLSQMYFPANSVEESENMLRGYVDFLMKSEDAPAVDEQQNCAEDK